MQGEMLVISYSVHSSADLDDDPVFELFYWNIIGEPLLPSHSISVLPIWNLDAQRLCDMTSIQLTRIGKYTMNGSILRRKYGGETVPVYFTIK